MKIFTPTLILLFPFCLCYSNSYEFIAPFDLEEIWIGSVSTPPEKKIFVIDSLKSQLYLSDSAEERFFICNALLNEYLVSDLDSAFLLASEMYQLAEQLDDKGYRYRSTLKVAEVLGALAYDKKVNSEKRALLFALILTTLIAVILLFILLFFRKHLKKAYNTSAELESMNKELMLMNERLERVNKLLSEANMVKESYIGSVFRLCSTYIDKMESYRKNIARKLKAGQLDEAVRLTSTNAQIVEELRDFYVNFDTIFLNLYPTYIAEFNSLLKEGEQLVPKSGDLLSPELRIYALIKLGFSDSSKIAGFLHYSIQTVYNYKMRVRSRMRDEKEVFYAKLYTIGQS